MVFLQLPDHYSTGLISHVRTTVRQAQLVYVCIQCTGETSIERVCTFRGLVMYRKQFFYISEGEPAAAKPPVSEVLVQPMSRHD